MGAAELSAGCLWDVRYMINELVKMDYSVQLTADIATAISDTGKIFMEEGRDWQEALCRVFVQAKEAENG